MRACVGCVGLSRGRGGLGVLGARGQVRALDAWGAPAGVVHGACMGGPCVRALVYV